MSQADQDKTEEPTPFRLEEARRKGQVAKSADLTGILVMVGFAAAFALSAGWLAHRLAQAVREMIQLSGAGPVLGPELASWLAVTLAPLGQALLPAVMAVMVVAVAANVLQSGPVFSTHPLKPDVQRMNPAKALKRIFSIRSLWELGKALVKLLLLTGLMWWLFLGLDGFAARVSLSPPDQLPALLASGFVMTALFVLGILALLALPDLIFSRREYLRQMRMSRRELKDEYKRREGDQEIKAKRKRLQRELMKRLKGIGKVPEADVVITNPTHYAVALKYRPASMRSPMVLAKGAGFLAARIRLRAERSGVPIMRVPALARAIHDQCGIEEPVGEAHYQALAPIYRWLVKRPGQRILA